MCTSVKQQVGADPEDEIERRKPRVWGQGAALIKDCVEFGSSNADSVNRPVKWLESGAVCSSSPLV